MTDKELQKLKRSELLEIMLGLQNELDNKIDEIKELRAKLDERQIALENAGNIAQAALEINGVLNAAQKSADVYLENIKKMHSEKEKKYNELISSANAEAEKILSEAKSKAEIITTKTNTEYNMKIKEAEEICSVKIKETEEACTKKIQETEEACRKKAVETEEACSKKIRETDEDCSRKVNETNTLCTRKIKETQEKCTAISSLDNKIATFFNSDNDHAAQSGEA